MVAQDDPKIYEIDFEHVRSVGRYELVCKLGQGATGTVYIAWDPCIKRNVALKIAMAEGDRYREIFMAEIQSAGRLSHPNIVPIYDAGFEEDSCYIAMQYIKGTTLEHYCQKENLMQADRGLKTILDVCKGLDFAHAGGIIHRDIKPSNILLSVEGNAKITDFGIAQMTDKTFVTGIWGTPHYLSPEQIKEEAVSFQSDIFSLGSVLYEILTGQKAFPGVNSYGICYKINTDEPAPILSLRPDLPKIFEQIVKKALAKNPKDRYRTCVEFAGDLTVALRGLSNVPHKGETVNDIPHYLHKLSFFANFRIDDLRQLASLANVVKAPKGSLIACEGEIEDTFHIILSGRAKVRKGEKDIALVSSGECFGEMGCIAGQQRVANVLADTDCILLKLTATQLDDLPDSMALLFYKNFARTLVRRLSRSLEEKE